MRDIISGIYCIENTVDGKRYVGKSKNIYKRLTEHKYWLSREFRYNRKTNQYLWNAVKKHGLDAFKFYILEDIGYSAEQDDKFLASREEYWIEIFRSYDKNFGYNLVRVSAITKLTQEHKDKISKALLGRKHKPEDIAKMSKIAKERGFGSKIGRVVSETTRLKTSLSLAQHSFLAVNSEGKFCVFAVRKVAEDYGYKVDKINKSIKKNRRYKHMRWAIIPFIGVRMVEKYGFVIQHNEWIQSKETMSNLDQSTDKGV